MRQQPPQLSKELLLNLNPPATVDMQCVCHKNQSAPFEKNASHFNLNQMRSQIRVIIALVIYLMVMGVFDVTWAFFYNESLYYLYFYKYVILHYRRTIC